MRSHVCHCACFGLHIVSVHDCMFLVASGSGLHLLHTLNACKTGKAWTLGYVSCMFELTKGADYVTLVRSVGDVETLRHALPVYTYM